MVGEDLETAIDNFVEVFLCGPKDQAKSMLRRLIQEHTNIQPLPPSEDLGIPEHMVTVLQKENQELSKRIEVLQEKAETAENQNEELKKWNEKLKERVQNAERHEAEERRLRQAHDETLDQTVERLGGKVDGKKTAKHNFLERIDELIEKEKAHLKPKSNKKK